MKKRCFYSIIHYIPSLVRGEFINIGVALQCGEGAVVHCRMLGEIDRILCFDRKANPAVIKALLADLDRRFNSFSLKDLSDENFLHSLAEEYSNHIQLTPPRLCMADDLEDELQVLYDLFVAEE